MMLAPAQGASLPRAVSTAVLLTMCSSALLAQEPSTCFGTTADGALENGWKLPASGANFSAYSTIGAMLGRTWVHSDVHGVVLDAYAALETSVPGGFFVYGETGKKDGGPFEPHKTHRNGLSVDFMVPVVDSSGKSVPLPTSVLNKWGYNIEFDSAGRYEDLSIDAETMAEHIFELHQAAGDRGIEIRRVIFAPELQPLLHQSARWPYLRQHVEFSARRSWVRHDEHYHIDFVVQCQAGDRQTPGA